MGALVHISLIKQGARDREAVLREERRLRDIAERERLAALALELCYTHTWPSSMSEAEDLEVASP